MFHQRFIPDGCGTTKSTVPFHICGVKYSAAAAPRAPATFQPSAKTNRAVAVAALISQTRLGSIAKRSPFPSLPIHRDIRFIF